VQFKTFEKAQSPELLGMQDGQHSTESSAPYEKHLHETQELATWCLTQSFQFFQQPKPECPNYELLWLPRGAVHWPSFRTVSRLPATLSPPVHLSAEP